MSSSHAEGAQGASTTKRPLWRQTVMVCNSQGGEEAFTVGPDGCVWNFFPDSASDSGYNLVNLTRWPWAMTTMAAWWFFQPPA